MMNYLKQTYSNLINACAQKAEVVQAEGWGPATDRWSPEAPGHVSCIADWCGMRIAYVR